MNLRRIIPIIPPALLAATVFSTACGRSIYPPAPTSSSSGTTTATATSTSSASATATPTATASASVQALAFVTNNGDATVSAFARDTNTGNLTLAGTADAGAGNGPEGIAVAPDNRAVYVANNADGKIYQYNVSASGALTPMDPPAVSNAPDGGTDALAVARAGNILFATNSRRGTLTTYRIDANSDALEPAASFAFPGDSQPSALAADWSGDHVYAGDAAGGVVYGFSVDSSGALRNSGEAAAIVRPDTLILSGEDNSLYAVDAADGTVAQFSVKDGKLAFVRELSSANSAGAPGAARMMRSGIGELLVPPSSDGSAAAVLSTAAGAAANAPSAPTVAVADPEHRFLYAIDRGGAAVEVFAIGSACSVPHGACLKQRVPSGNPANAHSEPSAIALTH